jgi:hypothetical protein
MKKQIGSKIAASYWKTEAGQTIAGAMHGVGWEAVDCLNSVIDTLEEGIAATTDAATVEELKKARKLMVAAKETYWKASAILRDDTF